MPISPQVPHFTFSYGLSKLAFVKKMYLLTPFLCLPSQTFAMEIAIIPRSMKDMFRSGKFQWIDIVAFLFHLIELLLAVAGSIAVILIMIGGFQYVFGSIAEDKQKGATTVKNTVFGFVVILLAWIIVDLVAALFTSP